MKILLTVIFAYLLLSSNSNAQSISNIIQDRINQDLSQIKQDQDNIAVEQKDIVSLQADISTINAEVSAAQMVDQSMMNNK